MKLRALPAFALLLSAPLLLSGCLVKSAVGVVGETLEAGVEITGAAAGAVVDVATPDGDDKKKKDKDD